MLRLDTKTAERVALSELRQLKRGERVNMETGEVESVEVAHVYSFPSGTRQSSTDSDDEFESMRDDDGNMLLDDAPLAEFVAQEMRPTFRHSTATGWYRYDGKRWREISEDQATKAVMLRLKRLFQTEAKRSSSSRIKQLLPLLRMPKIRNVRTLLRGLVEQDAADFDAHEHLLNCPNGVVDLRTGDLQPHDPELLFTKITAVEYTPGATHEDWNTALEAIPDEETRTWLQRKLGQAITGKPAPDDVLPILYGGGQNGKSSLVAVSYALGEYAKVVPDKLLTARPDAHSTELTELKGARLALLEELPERSLNIARLKSILGTAKLTARRVMKDSMEWDATHTLVVTTNYKPRVSEADFGTWRRLALVKLPYRFRIPPQKLEQDNDRVGSEGLRGRLEHGHDQRVAMLAWLVAGAMQVYDGGDEQRSFPPPARVKADTAEWRGDSDLVLRFVTERLEFDAASCVLSTELYEEFSAFTGGAGQMVPAANTFADSFGTHEVVTEHGVRKVRKNVGRSTGELSRRWVTRKAGDPKNPVFLWLGVRFRHPL